MDDIFRKAGPDNCAANYIHFQYAMNALNTGDISKVSHHPAIADSIATKLRWDDDAYFRSYSNLLHAMIDFKRTERIKLMHINGLTNHQSERYNRMKASQWGSERGALQQESRALALKAESEAKDLFNTSQNEALKYSNAVQIIQKNFSTARSGMVNRFNTTRDRYRGSGAENTEKSRF